MSFLAKVGAQSFIPLFLCDLQLRDFNDEVMACGVSDLSSPWLKASAC